MNKTIVAAAVLMVPAWAWAQATTSTPRIDQRQANQAQRIEQGVASGALTARETQRLEHGQAHVQRMEDKAVADGKVTPQERRRIEHAQDAQSRKIHREKHDRQTARR